MQVSEISFRVCGRTVVAVALLATMVSSAAGRSGNYLIVTAETYDGSAPLNEFIDAKTAQGFDVMTYSVPSGTSNTAIRSYIQGLWGTPDAPDYILIVGDTNGYTSSTTTIPHWEGEASRHACTDLYYACMDGGDDWYPDITIGRFSVRSVSTLQDVVDKSLFVETGIFDDPNYVKRAAFLATSDSTSGAEETHNWVIATYMDPAEFECTKIYASHGGGTTDISNAVNNGCLFVTYGGHSGSSGWSEPAFYQSNVQALTNEGMYGLVFGWSCNSARYSSDECFGETWLRVADRGSAAYLSASDLIFWGSWEAWEPSRQLERYFFESFFADDIWEVGPAWQAGLYDFLADYGAWDGNHEHPPQENYDVCRNFFEEFVLLGEPSLLLPGGLSFSLNPDPWSRTLCSPPTDEAVYTIEVEQIGDFTDPVTLSTDGTPPGSSVDFSANSLPPPFTTVMTVSNITGGSPGEYDIRITGTAADVERQVIVRLHLADSTPSVVTLTSPPDGAIDVSRTPTLKWLPASQAAEYDLEIATDPGFVDIVRSTTTDDTSYTPTAFLDGATLHFWHVRAVNGCGDSGFCPAFSFTTLEQADYFTEEFTSGVDLEDLSIHFIPDGTGDYYGMCGIAANELPTDPAGATTIYPGEDGWVHLDLSGGETVWLYGTSYEGFDVNSNGNITFNGGDSTWNETFSIHFNRPRISGLFDDFSPQDGGRVSWQQFANRAVVTFENVPEYGSNNDNTFQIEMFFDGEIHITWTSAEAGDGIVGLSEGNGLPGDFIESDLSAAGPCGPDFNITADPASLEVCAPDDAVYTIDIEPVQGFSETVMLSADGHPAGTNVGFSVNPVTPPGTSVMTISNTGAAMPGKYWIEITGTATGSEHTTLVELDLAYSVPEVVTLTSPENGATDVALIPELIWQPSPEAWEYDLEIATDADFSNVVYSATVTDTSHTLDSDLEGATLHFWHVRGVNACGQGPFSTAFHFTTVNKIMPAFYDLLNGESGSYTYFDDDYDGDGNNSQPLAPLTNGLGDLTNGVIAAEHWNVASGPYVGWVSIDPTITFHFDQNVNINVVTLHLDDSGGGGGVYAPDDVTIVMGGQTLVFPCSDPPGDEPFAFTLEDLALSGDTLELTIADYSTSGYMMLSEVEFHGSPVTGACCTGFTCEVMTEAECLAQQGEYQGDDAGCDPNPCITCPGDLDGDNDIDLADLAQLLAHYGMTSGAVYENGDLDEDGDVDLSDLAALLAVYGTTCP